MKTKEAIEFLEECQDEITELQEKGHDELLIKVINLLQRGEKFEEIVLEFDKWFEEYVLDHSLATLGNIYKKWKKEVNNAN